MRYNKENPARKECNIMRFKRIKQRGQVLALYGLLIPFLLLFVGVGLDLGWYYLNVSRLQNAADAAALAGALELVEEDKTMNSYYVDGLTFPPSDLLDENQYKNFNIRTVDGVEVQEVEILASKTEARNYASQNLYDVGKDSSEHAALEEITTSNKNQNWVGQIANEWTKGKPVSFKAELFTKAIDMEYETRLKRATDGIRYYKVELVEKVRHLFMPGWFEPMDATVVACAMIRPRDIDLITTVNAVQKEKVVENWEYQKKFHNFDKKWNHYRQTLKGGSQSDGKNIFYKDGDVYRSETVNVTPDKSKSDAVATEANGGKIYDEYETDSINIDFNQDFVVSFAVSEDWDLRSTSTPNNANITYRGMAGWTAEHGFDLRIQGLINLNGAWHNRNLHDTNPNNNLESDLLWTRIEADPMWSKGMAWGNQTSLNSVHQMIINVNFDNTAVVDADEHGNPIKDAEGNPQKAYQYRPYFILYMGPESNLPESNPYQRKSQPLILNLNTDFNGILYAPNSPVIINGNGHKLKGFVIAKEYRFLKTEEDFLSEGYISILDSYGNTIYINPQDLIEKGILLTEEEKNQQIAEDYPGSTVKENSNGYLSVYKESEARKYLIIDPRYVKGVEGSSDADYINALKEYKKITDLDTQTAKITFPRDEDTFGGYVNTTTYTVARKDLYDNQIDNNYVKVLEKVVTDGEETTTERYIAKTDLPYVRVYRKVDNKACYPYVPVCDLRVKKTSASTYEKANGTHPYGYAGVTLADDDHDVYDDAANVVAEFKDYVIDDKTDTWKVERNVLEGYQTNYKKNYISKGSYPKGGNFFNLTTEMKIKQKLVAEYRKIEYDDKTYYLKETSSEDFNKKLANGEIAATYYMKVTSSGRTDGDREETVLNPPIIVDNKGDLQTKQITPLQLLDVETKAQNDAAENASDSTSQAYFGTYTRPTNANEQPHDPGNDGEGGIYRGSTNNHAYKDYMIPSLERVYLADKCFNLNAATGSDVDAAGSMYSYFQVDDLVRMNYLYLNVDELNHTVNSAPSDKWDVKDMFFTTKRASWID